MRVSFRALRRRWVYYPYLVNVEARHHFLATAWHSHPESERVLDIGSGDRVNEPYVVPWR